MTKVRDIAVIDFETDPFKHERTPKPFCAGFYDGKILEIFWGPDCAEKLFERCKQFRGLIYAHNGGKFDFHYLLKFFDATVDTLRMIKSRIAAWKTNFGEFRDSFCILPVPLKTLGKDEIDYAIMEEGERDKPQNKKTILSYLKTDLYSLYDRVKEFIETYGSGLTIAGRSFAILKKDFGINPPKGSEKNDTRMRPFYYGGRVEFFELGIIEGPITCVDINSAYPRAMTERHAWECSFTKLKTLPPAAMFEKSFFDVEGVNMGALPFRSKEGRLIFTQHEGRFKVTGWELKAALDLGLFKIDKIHQVYMPNTTQDFTPYVDHFYALKNKADRDSLDYTAAKLFLNAPYGRFAMNPREFKDVSFWTTGTQHPDNVEILHKWRSDNAALAREGKPALPYPKLKWEMGQDFSEANMTLWEKPSDLEKARWFNVATAASITGHVRATMLRALHSVKGALYCDTDSIFCRDVARLEIGANLGQWKVEGVFDRMAIAGKKLYSAESSTGKGKLACKGVKLTPEQIFEVARGGEVAYCFDAPNFSLFSDVKWTERRIKRADREFLARNLAA